MNFDLPIGKDVTADDSPTVYPYYPTHYLDPNKIKLPIRAKYEKEEQEQQTTEPISILINPSVYKVFKENESANYEINHDFYTNEPFQLFKSPLSKVGGDSSWNINFGNPEKPIFNPPISSSYAKNISRKIFCETQSYYVTDAEKIFRSRVGVHVSINNCIQGMMNYANNKFNTWKASEKSEKEDLNEEDKKIYIDIEGQEAATEKNGGEVKSGPFDQWRIKVE